MINKWVMENFPDTGDQPKQQGCINCGNLMVETGYPTPLCSECRQNLIKFPIPLAIKIFAIAIGAILIFSISRAEKNLSAGVHLQRGKRAEKKLNYVTAGQEYHKAIQSIPGLREAKCHLLIASFYNLDFKTLVNTFKELEGEKIDDESLYQKMTMALNNSFNYFPSDSFNKEIEKYHTADSIPGDVYKLYIHSNPAEIYPITSYSSVLFDKTQYQECDSFLNIALFADRYHAGTLGFKASVKRELHQFDSSIYYCDQLLLLNKESTYGISSKARTFFKQRKDKEGLELALKSFSLDNKDPYSIATLVMAYHLTNKTAERDELMEINKKDTLVAPFMKYVIDIISGKEKFRD